MKQITQLFFGLLLVCGEGALASQERSYTIVELVHTALFSSPDGSDVVLNPGIYELEAAENWLRVIPHEGTRAAALLLEAEVLTHAETLDRLSGVVTMEGDGTARLALLLPGGKGLQAIGYTGGILSRAVPRRSGGPISQESGKHTFQPSGVSPQPAQKDSTQAINVEKYLFVKIQELEKKIQALETKLNGRIDQFFGKYTGHGHTYDVPARYSVQRVHFLEWLEGKTVANIQPNFLVIMENPNLKGGGASTNPVCSKGSTYGTCVLP